MIVKRRHTGQFAVIPNLTANDEQLTAEALGLLVYLLAKPSDWQVSVENLRKRFGMGRNRAYSILSQLENAGYVQKRQGRNVGSNRFKNVEYVVFDSPEAAKEHLDTEPLPQNRDAEKPQEKAASRFTVYGKQGHILKTDITKPPSEERSASSEASASPPSVSKQIWDEGRDLLKTSIKEIDPSIVGKWLKRVPTPSGKEKLLAMIRAARSAGTADPVSYVTAALNREFPPPPDPGAFTPETWARNVQAAIKCRQWSETWGPAPGKKGCKLPMAMITPALTQALQTRRIAA
jgi:hypothetical protein